MKARNSEDKCKGRSTSIIDPMIGASHGKGISVFATLQRPKSPTWKSSKSQSPTQTEETSDPCHMKRASHTKNNTAGDVDIDDSDDTCGEESGCGDDDRRPDRHKRPDKEKQAEETNKAVSEMTLSMKE